ncbi:MAG: transglycosylase domain-containing protein, partial [Dehalococcoidia bacterium]|nr:transglycosylase domain-containing protein [Dehalococcoidia bacterium]
MVSHLSFRFALITFTAALLVSVSLYFWVFADLPNPLSLSNRAGLGSTKILDRNGKLLYEIPEQATGKRTRIPLDDFPSYLLQATIATEDGSFYNNHGVDFTAIARAFVADLRDRQVVSGASTITQQLIRSALLSADERQQRTFQRKAREAVLAFAITRLYSKDTVLEAYLNEIYYGNMAYGAEAAAEAYFAKPARNLDLAESALLAGLPQSPADYNPLTNLDAALRRQSLVLDLMVGTGYITEQEAAMAKGEKLVFAAAPFDIKAPHFVAYAMDVLESEFSGLGIGKRGLRVVTTLDYGLQSSAEEIARAQLARLTADNVSNASLIALDPRSGDILAMVVSAEYFEKNIDGAVNVATSLRQPGSSIKPLTYA